MRTITTTKNQKHSDWTWTLKAQVGTRSYWGYGNTLQEAKDNLKENIEEDLNEKVKIYI